MGKKGMDLFLGGNIRQAELGEIKIREGQGARI